MDIKAKIEQIVDKIKSDKTLMSRFQKDPVSVVEELIGVDLPNDQIEKLVDAAVELNADAIMASTIISHDNIHYKNMKRIHELAVEKGIRDKVMIACGGTQVIPEEAVKQGVDAGFGRNSHGVDVATFLVERRREMNK